MGITIVTPPVTDPVTIEEAKAFLRVTSTNDDAQIAAFILAARQHAENYTRRKFITQTLDYTINGNWPWKPSGWYPNGYDSWFASDFWYSYQKIDIPYVPVQSITSINYVDNNGVTQTLDPSLYVVKSDEELSYIVPPYLNVWPFVRFQQSSITVRFVCGWDFSEVPAPIREAIKLHVQLLYDRDVTSKPALESARDSLLDPYRVIRIL